MKFLVKWFDLDEVVDSATISYFHAVRLLRYEGVEESTASLFFDTATEGCSLRIITSDGYVLTLEKVEG